MAHCSDVKDEPAGQPIFPVEFDGETKCVKPDEVTLAESTAHYCHLVNYPVVY